ncbi:MAG: transglutaminase family protein [Gemmataceae bacterium]
MFARLASLGILALLICPDGAAAQQANPSPVQNPGFEASEPDKPPTHWFFPPVCKQGGYELAVSEDQPFAGKRCVVMKREAKGDAEAFGNILQSVDATPFRGKRIRFKAAVRAEVKGDGNQAMLWLRVDRPKDEMGFFDNMADRPIKEKAWKHYEIVGDVAADAETIVVGMMLMGNGTAALDDVSLEIVEKTKVKTTGMTQRQPAPGLAEVVMAEGVTPVKNIDSVTLLFPLPLAYRDQVPLTFRLEVDPPQYGEGVEVVEGPGDNRVLKLKLHDLEKDKKFRIEYHSLVLVAPTEFKAVPKLVPFPKEWPAEAQPWLASTWAVDHENDRVKKVAQEIRGESKDVMEVIEATVKRAQDVFAKVSKVHVRDLTSVEALDKQGSCTSCANLVAALLRGAGIPARVLSGYPLWSGPLQTHYIVEAYVPGYGWYPIESTMCRAPWPNHQQVNVSIVPIEHERKDKAGLRRCAAGAVPYLSLTECGNPSAEFMAMGTLKSYCDHEARMVRPMTANDLEWAGAMAWAKPRWSAWTKSQPKLANGKLMFGPDAGEVKAATPTELQAELK